MMWLYLYRENTKQQLLIIGLIMLLSAACSSPQNTSNTGIIAPAKIGSETYRLGQNIYYTTCASCHGENGQGQFPDAPMQPDNTGRIGAPPHNGMGHTWHHDDGLLLRYVRDGGMGDPNRFYPMPGFGDVLTEKERIAVIAYIKTLWTSEQQTAQRERTIAIQAQQQ